MPSTEIIATFPPGFFLENIATDTTSGLIITCANRHELYYIPLSPPSPPFLLHVFPPDQWPFGIIPAAPSRPSVFYLLTSDFTGQRTRTSHLHLLDLSNVASAAHPLPILTFPPETTGLNGLCALSDSVLLAADSFGARIWRIDLDPPHAADTLPASGRVSVWLQHETMAAPLELPDFQPGVNGLKYSAKTGRVYFTSTRKRLFCQVRVEEGTLAAEGEVEVVASGMQGDDLVVDDESEEGPFAYVTTHRDNTLVRVRVDGRERGRVKEEVEVVVSGGEESEELLGPTAGAWAEGSVGRVVYLTTDGGLKNPPRDGRARCARVVKVTI